MGAKSLGETVTPPGEWLISSGWMRYRVNLSEAIRLLGGDFERKIAIEISSANSVTFLGTVVLAVIHAFLRVAFSVGLSGVHERKFSGPSCS